MARRIRALPVKQSVRTEGGMKLGAAIILAILFSLGSGASAQQAPARQGIQGTDKVPPVPVPKVETVPLSPPANPEPDLRGTEQTPLVVKVLPAPTTNPETANNAPNQPNKATNPWGLSDEIALIAIVVGFLLFAILVAILIAMLRSSRRRRRAYVWCRATELHDLEVGKLPYVKLEVRNAGQTPAYDLQIAAECLVYESPLLPKTPFPPIKMPTTSRMVLHPGAEPPFEFIVVFGRTDVPGLPAIQVNELIKGDKIRLFVFVIITYRDAFWKRRETRLCVSVVATNGPGGASMRQINFSHSDQHNTAS
jgi:hypothetical protein